MEVFKSTLYKKLDLHVHTPHSSCYSDPTVNPEQIVSAAVAAGLDAIAVTDHNTVEGIEDICKAAIGESLVVFPGMEITTGSGHFLAIFDVDKPLFELRELLDNMGVISSAWGDGTEPVRDNVEDVFKKVVQRNGLIIAAHIERWPSGFLETKETRSVKMAIHASPCLSALEITVAQNRKQWNNGMMRGYPKKYACIQGSDAHAPSDIGRRPFFVRMETVGLETLKFAFANWDDTIFFPDEMKP